MEGLEVKLVGKDGKTVTFNHKDLPKVTYHVEVSLKKNVTINLPKLLDAIGYNLEVSGNASAGTGGFSAFLGSSFVIFTNGDYKYQPFRYFYLGATAGPGLAQTFELEESATLGISVFAADYTGSDDKITPYTWEKGFSQTSYSGGGFFEVGLSAGFTNFQSLPFKKNGGWRGTSIDLSGGVGGGYHASKQNGPSYYFLAEQHVTKTKDLLSSVTGQTRFTLKWAEFLSGGTIPGTKASDKIEDYRQDLQSLKKLFLD